MYTKFTWFTYLCIYVLVECSPRKTRSRYFYLGVSVVVSKTRGPDPESGGVKEEVVA